MQLLELPISPASFLSINALICRLMTCDTYMESNIRSLNYHALQTLMMNELTGQFVGILIHINIGEASGHITPSINSAIKFIHAFCQVDTYIVLLRTSIDIWISSKLTRQICVVRFHAHLILKIAQ